MIKKILVVEDERDLLFALSTKLEHEGYTVIQSVNGSDALLKVQSEQPDLIILDIIIIGKSGIEFLRDLRESLHSQIPVIVSSNLYDQTYIDKAQAYGISGYIVKSDTSLQELIDSIKAIGSSEK